MGDPETQPMMARLKSDFVDLLQHAIDGTLDQIEAEWDPRAALGVVLAAADYPSTPRTGDVITGIPLEDDHHVVFHAASAYKDGNLVTNGGRVLCVVGLDRNIKGAQTRAYDAVQLIHFDGMQYRQDIGHHALKK
jgi:phosphoribosylamine--glycine ligase